MTTVVFSDAKRKLHLAYVFFMAPLSGFTIDLVAPSLPAMQSYFMTEEFHTKLVITAYLLGYGFFQLISGVFCDSVGRKKFILVGLFAYICITTVIPFSPNIHTLLLLRILQGVAVSFFGVAVRSIVADVSSSEEEFRKHTNSLTIAWAIGPIIAPFFGGYIQHFLGWKANFYLLDIYALVSLLLALLILKETLLIKVKFEAKNLFVNYKEMLMNKIFVASIVCLSLFYSVLIIFNVVTPFIIQVTLNKSPIFFGYIALAMGMAWFFGGVANRFLFATLPMNVRIGIAILMAMLTSFIMLMLGLSGYQSMWTLAIPAAIIIFFLSMCFPNYFASSIALFPKRVASANALMGATLMMLSSILTSAAGTIGAASITPLALIYLGITSTAFLIYFFFLRKQT